MITSGPGIESWSVHPTQMLPRRSVFALALGLLAAPSVSKAITAPRPQNPETILEADRLARSRYTYKLEAGDHWDSYADEVLAGQAWEGDCDDLASTTLDLMLRQGWPETRLMRALVAVDRKSETAFDHMVGIAIDRNGRIWVCGDCNAPHPYPIFVMPYRMFACLPYDCWSFQV